ncbi:hypothetical protein K431DRAFT_304797 [Polychaeton citri CBS 116435]|uniref:Uncharacterized protein n=1 Tax=Polychaeton citri CBS 116435 TaxID=1314669 RepID=A0A9P4Q4T9_9PEZI|nr:hypothetical protein K431DRAFT_304797 [Polychaeton citri CBS 116435]
MVFVSIFLLEEEVEEVDAGLLDSESVFLEDEDWGVGVDNFSLLLEVISWLEDDVDEIVAGLLKVFSDFFEDDDDNDGDDVGGGCGGPCLLLEVSTFLVEEICDELATDLLVMISIFFVDDDDEENSAGLLDEVSIFFDVLVEDFEGDGEPGLLEVECEEDESEVGKVDELFFVSVRDDEMGTVSVTVVKDVEDRDDNGEVEEEEKEEGEAVLLDNDCVFSVLNVDNEDEEDEDVDSLEEDSVFLVVLDVECKY